MKLITLFIITLTTSQMAFAGAQSQLECWSFDAKASFKIVTQLPETKRSQNVFVDGQEVTVDSIKYESQYGELEIPNKTGCQDTMASSRNYTIQLADKTSISATFECKEVTTYSYATCREI